MYFKILWRKFGGLKENSKIQYGGLAEIPATVDRRKRACSRSRNKIRAGDSPLFPRGRISCRNETRDPFIPAHRRACPRDNCAYRRCLARATATAPLRENNVIRRCTIARGRIIEKAILLGGRVRSRGNLRPGGPKSNLQKCNRSIQAGRKGEIERFIVQALIVD